MLQEILAKDTGKIGQVRICSSDLGGLVRQLAIRSMTRRMLVADASISPKKRTSPSRRVSAIAIAFLSFATSINAFL
ncbi:hypothetical protein [Bradyrhizobium sp. USDA 4504]